MAFAVAIFSVVGMTGVGESLLGGEPFVETLPGWGRSVLAWWMVCGALVSLALPVMALAIWGRQEGVGRALVPYMLVLVAQVLIEATFGGVFYPNIVVLTGAAFTAYRLGQLVKARRVIAGARNVGTTGRRVVGGILAAGLAFWTANLAFLVLVALPRVAGLA